MVSPSPPPKIYSLVTVSEFTELKTETIFFVDFFFFFLFCLFLCNCGTPIHFTYSYIVWTEEVIVLQFHMTTLVATVLHGIEINFIMSANLWAFIFLVNQSFEVPFFFSYRVNKPRISLAFKLNKKLKAKESYCLVLILN